MVEVGERFIAKPPGGYNIGKAGETWLNRLNVQPLISEVVKRSYRDFHTFSSFRKAQR